MSQTRAFRRCWVVALVAVAGCYPKLDWRDVRPDCAKGFCDFVASFPGRVVSATRDIAVGARPLPLTLHVVSVDRVTFAVGAFDLGAGGDATAARAVLEQKLLDDVGAASGTRTPLVLHAADRAAVPAEAFEAEGSRGTERWRAAARFAVRRGRVVEAVVIGPADDLVKPTGRQSVETFLTSLRLD